MKIHNNVPLPPITRRGRERKYPFHEMTPNDSVSFDDDDKFIKARRAARGYMNKHGGIFTSRKGYQIEKDENGEIVLDENGDPKLVYIGTGGTIWRNE